MPKSKPSEAMPRLDGQDWYILLREALKEST
jgi:hypothetical protein